jgi:hypothetical protein
MMAPQPGREVNMRPLVFLPLVLLSTPPVLAGGPEPYQEVTSINWVVNDIDQVAAGWAKLGFPVLQDFGEVTLPVRYRDPALTELRYHGKPGQFDQKLGWHRHGTVTWEWSSCCGTTPGEP